MTRENHLLIIYESEILTDKNEIGTLEMAIEN
jgi:hypothetical protein